MDGRLTQAEIVVHCTEILKERMTAIACTEKLAFRRSAMASSNSGEPGAMKGRRGPYSKRETLVGFLFSLIVIKNRKNVVLNVICRLYFNMSPQISRALVMERVSPARLRSLTGIHLRASSEARWVTQTLLVQDDEDEEER